MALRPSTKFAFAIAALGALSACGGDSPLSRQAVTVLPPPPAPPSLSQAPAPTPQMAPMQAPAPAAAPAPTPRAANGVLAGHLASYRTAESAQAGWQKLVRAQPALQTLKPYYVAATINGQPWVRVLAGDFPNTEEVNRFCNWARAQRLYCVPMTINSAGQTMPVTTAAPRPQRQPRGTPQPAAPAAAPAAPAGQSMMTPAQPAPPPVAAAPAAVAPPPPAAPAQQVSNPAMQPPQPLAPPLPPRRQPSQPAVPQ
jgi:hypothetical protein